jgi:hypothetical protein
MRNVGRNHSHRAGAPGYNKSAVLLMVTPGDYTSIVRGVDRTTGIRLCEAYQLSN